MKPNIENDVLNIILIKSPLNRSKCNKAEPLWNVLARGFRYFWSKRIILYPRESEYYVGFRYFWSRRIILSTRESQYYVLLWLETVSTFQCENNDRQLECQPLKTKLKKEVLGEEPYLKHRQRPSLVVSSQKGSQAAGGHIAFSMSLSTPNNHEAPYLWK